MGLDKEQLYNLEKTYKNASTRLDKSKLSNENKKHTYAFIKHCKAKGIGKLRQIFYMDKLKLAGTVVDKDFKQWNKEDIVTFLAHIVDKGYTDYTIDGYKSALKCFFRWLNGCNKGDPTPKFLNVIERKKPQNKLEKEDLLTTDDVKKIISCCNNSRDRCMISMAFEMGLRNGELRGITVGDLVRNTHGYRCVIGQKGAKTDDSFRPAFFVTSEGYITNWLNHHPFIDDAESPLFCNRATRQVITLQGINKIISKASQKAIGRKIHQYIFRHSFGTRFTLKRYPEATIKKLMGHSKTSNVLATYQHIAERDTEDAILNEAGIRTKTKQEDVRDFKPMVCSQCGYKGTPTDIICPECNKVMDPDGVIAQETDLGFAISHEGLKSLMDIIKPAIQEELDKLWTRKNESLPARKEVQLCKKTV